MRESIPINEPKPNNTGSVRRFFIKSKPPAEIRYGDTPDTVAERYRIDYTRLIPYLATAFADAYDVTDTKDDTRPLYAAILHDEAAARLDAMNALCDANLPGFTNLLAYEVITVTESNTRRLALILERPPERTLREALKQSGAFSSSFTEEHMITQVHALLNQLSALGVCHGSLQPDRIYVDKNNRLIIGECFTFPCGFYQFPAYENLLRADVSPYAKGAYGGNVDYYALACLSASVMSGIFPDYAYDFLSIKYSEGAYRFFSDKLKLTSRMNDFLRGCLNESPVYSWKAEQVAQWTEGRRFNLLPPKLPLRLQRPVLFNGKKYYNVRHLAYGMGIYWDEAKKFLADSEAVRWLERSIENENLTKKLFMLHARLDKSEEALSDKTVRITENDKILTQFLLTLDPEGPLRLRGINAHVAGLGTFYAFVQAEKEAPAIAKEALTLFFNHTIFSVWEETQPDYIRVALEQHITLMRRAVQQMRRIDDRAGRLRTLYELNPSLPCLSPACKGKYILSAEEYMYQSEHGHIMPVIGELDEDIIAFLTHRLQLTRIPELRELKAFPAFSNNKTIKDLLLLAWVQRNLSLPSMPALTARISSALKSFTDQHFKSSTLKKRIHDSLNAKEKTGELMLLSEIVGVPRFHIVDKVGYRRASEEYGMNKISMLHLSDTTLIKKTGVRYGLYICIILSYTVAGAVLSALIYKAF